VNESFQGYIDEKNLQLTICHEHTYIRTYVHTYIHTFIHTYTHTYIYTYTHTHTHTHTHTDTHITCQCEFEFMLTPTQLTKLLLNINGFYSHYLLTLPTFV
ncbi:hypothetical protein LOAG_08392, partial [Loa loa]